MRQEMEIVVENNRTGEHNRLIGKSCRKYFREYTESTSLHGLKYVLEKSTTRIEKCCWFVAISLSIGFCAYLIANVWIKWQSTPVIVSFSETEVSIYKIPFPAVTVCDYEPSAEAMEEYESLCYSKKKLTENELLRYSLLTRACKSCEHETTDIYDERAINISRSFMRSIDDMYEVCTLHEPVPCEETVHPILTDMGWCYTFNMIGLNEIYRDNVVYEGYGPVGKLNDGWSLEKGYPAGSTADIKPLRATGVGTYGGFDFSLLYKKGTANKLCKKPHRGYHVALHLPDAIPFMEKEYLWLSMDSGYTIFVEPKVITTSDVVKNYPPEKRQCYMEDERQLRYFRRYSQSNCEVECVANLTLKMCNCTDLGMPHESGTNICTAEQNECTDVASGHIFLLEKATDEEISQLPFVYDRCNCLPGCTSLKYEIFASNGKLSHVGENLETDIYDYTDVSINFKSPQFVTVHRSELYGVVDFLANCGGLLGLCMGFSLLSLIEIIYFATLRLFCKSVHRRTDNL